jgi:DNA-binding MarR family transcriptional regulator
MSDKVNHPDTLNQLAREMVNSLDRILDQLIVAAPSEGAVCEIPLTLREVWVAKALTSRDPISMSALATSMGISLPTATHLVDRLVTKGVAVRIRPEHDRRMVLVALSERSKAQQRTFFENRVALILDILKPLEPAKLEQAVKVIGEIAELVVSRAANQARYTHPE